MSKHAMTYMHLLVNMQISVSQRRATFEDVYQGYQFVLASHKSKYVLT